MIFSRQKYPGSSSNKDSAMKIRRIISREMGSTLIATLTAAGILGSVLATYLAMTSQEKLKVKRSIGWNSALPSGWAR